MKKTLAILLALVMILSLATVASAASITVEEALNGETYSAYKIMEYSKSDDDSYSYYILKDNYESGLGELLTEAGLAFQASADGTQYILTTKSEDVDAEELAKYLYEKIETLETVAIASASEAATDEGVKFDNLETGYWFVTSSLGTLCTLQSYDADELVVEKNSMITDEKTVDEKSESVQIGDTLTYTITLTDGKGTNLEATLTDTMSAGLTYNNDAQVTANNKSLTKDTDYTVTVTGGEGEETKVVYTFTADVISALNEGEQIVVTYTATLNEYASLDGTETNVEYVEYSEQKTEGNTVEVKDYNLTVNKTDGTNPLKGAQFELYRDEETDPVELIDITDNISEPAEDTVYYRVATEDETGVTTIDMTDATSAVIYGLDGDSTYSLLETKSPNGYNLLDEAKEVAMEDGDQEVEIVNNSGSVLPSTGGIGTTLFYVFGGILVVGAAVVLVTKKRMTAAE